MSYFRCATFASLLFWLVMAPFAVGQSELGQSELGQSAVGQSAPEEARLYLADNEPERAAELLAAANSLSDEGYFVLGRAYQRLSQHDRAVEAFGRADSTSTRLLMSWAQSLAQLGLYHEAEDRYAEAFEAEGDYRAGFEWGRLLIRREAWPQAQRVLEEVREVVPEHAEVLHQLGVAYLEGRRPAPAIYHLHRARQLSPDNVRITLRLTGAQMEADSLNAAMRVVFGALERQPESPELWVRKGKIATHLLSAQAASEAFAQAMTLGDSTVETMQRAGVAQFESGQYERASSTLREVLRKDEMAGSAAFYLGLSLKEEGKFEEARIVMEDAAQLSGQPVLASIYEQLADVYMLGGAFQEAIFANQLALKLDPERVAVQFHLATVYDRYYRDRDPARRAYELFLNQVNEDDFPEMQEYARSRLRQLAGEQFFRD